jgi:hypothetical protein
VADEHFYIGSLFGVQSVQCSYSNLRDASVMTVLVLLAKIPLLTYGSGDHGTESIRNAFPHRRT